MNYEQHAFLKLMEECNEVAMVCSKIIQFGLDSEYEGKTNRERLTAELNDLLAGIIGCEIESNFTFERDKIATRQKLDKVAHFRGISENLGFVTASK